MSIKNFRDEVLSTYERNLSLFFDEETGAVIEPGREDGTPPFLFTEVTGYAILDRLLIFAATRRSNQLDAAKRAADWIIAEALDPTGGILTRYYFEHDNRPDLADKAFSGRRIYSFDTAICLRGFVALYKTTSDQAYLDAAKQMGRYLVETASDAAGNVVAIYDAKSAQPVPPNPEVWSRCFGAFLSKTGEALIELHSVTGDQELADRAIAICDAAQRFQGPHGQFQTSRGRTELHPHCYAAEGFLHVGQLTGEKRFIDAARRATEWALELLAGDEIPQVVDFETNAPLARFRTDALAQVLALGSDLQRIGELDARYDSALDALAVKVLAMRDGPQSFFRYGYYERAFGGRIEATTFSYWTQMFCLRGLDKYYLSRLVRRTYVAVLAGGIGSRVWPISCERHPKHLSYSFLGDRSLLQETIRRYTDANFISPDRVIVLCRADAMEQMAEQAAVEGVPRCNIVIEPEPKGTIPASMLALEAMPGDPSGDRLVVISMADNVISPYWAFQDAVKAGLIAAAENDCVISVGRPLEKSAEHDVRLGHMRYSAPVGGSRVHEVDEFVEKPNRDQFDQLVSRPGNLATESGAVICRAAYLRSLVPPGQEKGNLAETLLSTAKPWKTAGSGPRVATTLLGTDARFEDFGVPGRSLQVFHSGDARYSLGNGSVCIGNRSLVQSLFCSNNLVIAEKLPVRLYGIEGCVVIDAAVTNTSVIMPIGDVAHLPHLYRLFQGSQGYESFIKGGAEAQVAPPTTFVERSPRTVAKSSRGLVFAYNVPDQIAIHRSANGLEVSNLAHPEMDAKDFDVLAQRQAEDYKIVEHVIHVGTLAKALVGGDVALSATGKQLLNKLCLYHAIGGQLSPEMEGREKTFANDFGRCSKLDRRLIDTRIVQELLALDAQSAMHSEVSLGMLNHCVMSAVAFLRNNAQLDRNVRDIVTLLIQVQDSPLLYGAAHRNLLDAGLVGERDETAVVFAAFKAAQNFVNGRWLWKRTRGLISGSQAKGFLHTDRGEIEDYPFMLAFTIDWLERAGVDPRPTITRLNELLRGEANGFARALRQLDRGARPLVCDRLYVCLLNEPGAAGSDLRAMLQSALGEMGDDRGYQFLQILDLPSNLGRIAAYCPQITEAGIRTATDAILNFYHDNWRELTQHIAPELVMRLLKGRSPTVGPADTRPTLVH